MSINMSLGLLLHLWFGDLGDGAVCVLQCKLFGQ